MAEQGVNVINGTRPNSRSASPTSTPTEPKEKRFLNGWSEEQEKLMADWSDLAMCYRWLHDKSEKFFYKRNLWINLPVIVLSTLCGTANFGIQSVFNDNTSKQYASFAIGAISLFAGILTTVGNYLRYAQLEESHRVAGIAWGKFQRLIAVELSLKPDDRIDSLDFLKICRADLDRLIEQSPPIPEYAITLFSIEFGSITDIKKPDICGALEHTRVFQSSETRLKQIAVDAALFLKHKKNTLAEMMSPRVQETIKKQVEERLANALNERKKMFEEEIEKEKAHAKEMEEAFQRALEERQKAIQEEIEQEKKRMMGGVVVERAATSPRFPMTKRRVSHFEDRLQFKHNPLFTEKLPPPMKLAPEIPSVQEMEEPVKNIVIHIPKSSETEEKTLQSTPSFDQLSDV